MNSDNSLATYDRDFSFAGCQESFAISTTFDTPAGGGQVVLVYIRTDKVPASLTGTGVSAAPSFTRVLASARAAAKHAVGASARS